MTQIGSLEMAMKFANGAIPEGVSVLGSGCFRTAYLASDGVVYKVSHGLSTAQSLREVDRANEYRRLLAEAQEQGRYTDWEVAQCALFMVGDVPVVAMEYHEGEHPRCPDPCPKYWGLWGDMVDNHRKDCQQCEAYLTYSESGDRMSAYHFADEVGYRDMHPGNYVKRHSDGKKVLIDCG